jgi:Uma2 family endonuclease
MSITRPSGCPPPSPAADWIPSPVARLTIEQYEALVESGVFTKRDSFHLVNGVLVTKVTKNRPHVIATEETRRNLERIVPSGWHVMSEAPVCLPPNSIPEPDVALVRGKPKDHADHPRPADLALIVEVAEASVSEDRMMALVYGAAGIPVYWILNLKRRQVEVYTLKQRGGYGKPRIFKAGHSVPVMIEGREVGQIAVIDILPDPKPAAGGNGG